MGDRSNALAGRLEQGALALAECARGVSEADWRRRLPHDGRTIGVVVHHVASMYPLEIELSRRLADGRSIDGVTAAEVDAINAKHAAANAGVTRDEAVVLLESNSAMAAAAIRSLRDDELDQAATVSLYGDAPLTCQFFVEDHPLRHSYHHLSKIRAALAPTRAVAYAG